MTPTTSNAGALSERIRAVAQARDYVGLSSALEALGTINWEDHRPLRLQLARTLIRKGLARDGLDLLPDMQSPPDCEVEQLRAWGLANTGAPATAARVLQSLLDAGFEDSETLGLLGRTSKDLARRSSDPDRTRSHWLQALSHYQRAYELTEDSYPGINAAALLARTGAIDQARTLAQAVLDGVEDALRQPQSSDDWALATKAEALLILGRTAEAEEAYAAAAQRLQGDYSALGSTVRQARELLADLDLRPDRLEEAFALPRVAVFSGHRIDGQDRQNARFPQSAEASVRAALDTLLADLNVGVGYGAAANGADLLFMEAILDRGGEIHLVLPMEVEVFRALSVTDSGMGQWGDRFDALLARAASITIASEQVDLQDASVLDYGNRVALGMARLKSAETGTELFGIAVWDGELGLPGGTGDCVALWKQFDVPLHQIHPAGRATPSVTTGHPAESARKRTLMGMVFADIVGYSRLSEGDIERFYDHVLPRVAELSKEHGHRPVVTQSFGDAFYFVFASAPAAADFALAMNALFREQLRQFTELDLRIRIALHAGPLLHCFDPIGGGMNYTGRHTSKTARIEPVAPENQILTTQQFAALLALDAPEAYDLAYAGEQVLPKGYGVERLFVLSATSERH